MGLFSWFQSSHHVEAALIWVAIVGAIVELAVAVAAVVNVHKELPEVRKKKLEKYVEYFALVAAVFFVGEALLGWRASTLLSAELQTVSGAAKDAKNEAGKLNKEVADLRAENRNLKEQLRPRDVTAEQENLLRKHLKDAPKGNVELKFSHQDSDASAYTGKIQTILSDSGFDVKCMDVGFEVWPVPWPDGLIFLERNGANQPPHFGRLVDAFSKAGFTIGGIQCSASVLSDDVVVIRVSSKPPAH